MSLASDPPLVNAIFSTCVLGFEFEVRGSGFGFRVHDLILACNQALEFHRQVFKPQTRTPNPEPRTPAHSIPDLPRDEALELRSQLVALVVTLIPEGVEEREGLHL